MRQGLWIAVLVCIPLWLFMWNVETVLLWMGQDPALARGQIRGRWIEQRATTKVHLAPEGSRVAMEFGTSAGHAAATGGQSVGQR